MAEGGNSKDWPTLDDSKNVTSVAAKNRMCENLKSWPTLSDSTNISTTTSKKEQPKAKAEASDGLKNSSTSTNGNMNGARRKTGKIKWSRVSIDVLSYRDNRNDKQYYESNKFYTNGRRSSSNDSSNSPSNGHENAKARSFRGGKNSRGQSQFRSRRENTQPSESRRYSRAHQDVGSVSDFHSEVVEYDEPINPSDVVKEQVKRQIEYYFSETNLVKDTYLRRNLDEQGYAKISLIASFPRIKSLTGDVQLILKAVKESSYLEVSENKVRPVVDPLRWPLKRRIEETSNVNASDPYLDLVSGQLFNLCLDPSAYHITAPKCDMASEFPWQYIAVDNSSKNGAVFCPINSIYPPIDSNSVNIDACVTDIPNGYVCTADQPDISSSDLSCDLASQFVSNEILPHNDSNGINDTSENAVIPNGNSCMDQVISPLNSEGNDENTCQYVLNDCQLKSSSAFCAVNGIHPAVDSEENVLTEDSVILNGHSCSSEVRPVDEANAYSYYGQGQMANGVIMYNSGGRYYVTPSNEILASSDSAEDKSALHNKSPEPSR